MPKLEKITDQEKKPLRVGMLLISLASLLILLVVKIDQVETFLSRLGHALMPMLMGVFIAYMLNVLVYFFEGVVFTPIDRRLRAPWWRQYKRGIAILLSLATALFFFYLILFVILPELSQSIQGVLTAIQVNGPRYFYELRTWLEEFIRESQIEFDPNLIFGRFNWESIINTITNFSSDILSSVVNATMNVTSAIFTGVVSFIFSLYFLVGKEKLIRNLKSLLYAFLPENFAKKIDNTASLTNYVFFQFVRGQLVECLILGGLCYVGMSLFRFDYAVLISSVIAISALIPIFGAYIGAGVGAVIQLLINPMRALWFLVFILVLQQLEGNLIYPKVVGHSIGLPPVWTMGAVVFWGAMLGVPGILLGTPLTAVIYRLLRRSVTQKLTDKNIRPEKLDVKPRNQHEPPLGNTGAQERKLNRKNP